jgi:hypothetical protein
VDKRLEEILDICLEEMKRGKSMENCLKGYPRYAKELEPLLTMALRVEKIPQPEPRKEAMDVMLVRMGEALVEQPERRAVFGKSFLRPFIEKPILVRALATILVVIVAVWSMGMISSRSIPGDLLYPVKTTSEKVRFSLTRNVDGKVSLRLEFADTRLEELLKVVEKRGYLDESALQALLKEAEIALDEAQTMDEVKFKLFLAQLDHFNNYTKDALEQVKPRLTERECEMVDHAINICHNRSQHMMQMRRQNGKHMEKRKWGPGCHWK